MSRTPHLGGASAPKSVETFAWDNEVPQLAERRRGNSASWIVQFRVGERTVRRRLCAVHSLSLSEAREQALAMLKGFSDGGDTAFNPTIRQFAPRFMEDCAHQWKRSTYEAHYCGIRNHILPPLGDHRVGDLSREDVIAWRHQSAAPAGTLNRSMAVLSLMMRHAELLGLRPAESNPCAGLRKRKSEFKADYLGEEAYAKLGRILNRQGNRFLLAVPFVRFVTLTGCRKSEAVGAQWGQLDGDRLTLPDSKTGPKAIWLGKPVLELLATLPRHGAGIFSGDDPKPLLAELRKLWPLVREGLGRPNFRLHDLRHSFASLAVNSGFSLQVIGGLLGHSDMDSTAGYAHLDVKTVEQASTRVGEHLGKAFQRSNRGRPRTRPLARPSPEHFQAFAEQQGPLPAFCSKYRLDPGAFLTGYIAWQDNTRASKKTAGE